MVKCIRVPKRDAQNVRKDLMDHSMLDRSFKITTDGDFVLMPINSQTFEDFEVLDIPLERSERRETDYRELLNIGPELKDMLPTSFDVIGDVVLVKIPESLLQIRNDIGNAILDTHSTARIVMMDYGVKGDLRIRELECIAGSGTSETVHKEFGVRMATDPSRVYFNPRLATERMRVASQVKHGEIIIDMFAGVAPFPLVISKHSGAREIYAIDLNPDAMEFMVRNIEMNKVENITPMNGDARAIIKELPKADRVIMNLPQSASDFLEDALNASKIGATIHLHRISERDPGTDAIKEMANDLGYAVEVSEPIELKTYSPSMSVYVFDIVNKGLIS